MALPASAQGKDLVGPEGSVETSRIERELDEYPLPVAPFGGEAPTVTLTGAVTWTAWRMPADGQTVTSVVQDYREVLARMGFVPVLDCSGQACGGFDFRFEAALLPPPGMAMDVQDFAQLSGERRNPLSYASVLVSQVRDSIYVQIVMVVPQDPDFTLSDPKRAAGGDGGGKGTELPPDPLPPSHEPTVTAADATPTDGAGHGPTDTSPPAAPDDTADGGPAPAGADASDPPDDGTDEDDAADLAVPTEDMSAVNNQHIAAAGPDAGRAEDRPVDAVAAPPDAEPTGTEPADGPQDGAPLLESLTRFGHVPVDGLAFESGGAALTEESGPALDRMAKMLTDNPELRISIVGHSDNRGPLRVNIAISQKRAATVRQALIERGVDGERMEARGIGYLAPRRSNETEEGRALNRRVELVLREAQ